MTVRVASADDGEEVCISVAGRFDFSAHASFREAYQQLPEDLDCCVVDMAKARVLDSAALGMLLLLRDRIGGGKAGVRLVNCSEQVREVLRIACFDSLLTVE